MAEIIGAIVVSAGIPSAILSCLIRRLEKKHEAKEKAIKDYETYQIKMTTAMAALCQANAIALQNGKCNGETERALEYLQQVKHEQRDFLVAQGIQNMF